MESGTIASYTCERGFELLGPARRVCDNGQWTPDGIPFCGKHSNNLLTFFHSSKAERETQSIAFIVLD